MGISALIAGVVSAVSQAATYAGLVVELGAQQVGVVGERLLGRQVAHVLADGVAAKRLGLAVIAFLVFCV